MMERRSGGRAKACSEREEMDRKGWTIRAAGGRGRKGNKAKFVPLVRFTEGEGCEGC